MVASKIMKKMLQTRGQHHFMICLHKQLDIFCRRRKWLPGSLLFVPLCVCCLVYTRVCICLCAWLRVYLCSLWRHSPFPRVCLYCGAAEALPVAVSSTQTQTPAAFTVTDLRCPLMSALLASPWPQTHCASTNHLQFQKKKKGKKQLTLIYMFLLSNWEEKLFDICAQKTSCSALGTLGCLTDWLHGQSSQGLSLCPTAFQTAPGLREFCLRQKNDKLELHFPKSECLGLD